MQNIYVLKYFELKIIFKRIENNFLVFMFYKILEKIKLLKIKFTEIIFISCRHKYLIVTNL